MSRRSALVAMLAVAGQAGWAMAGGLTITPSANPVAAGAQVTFTIQPAVGGEGDSVTVNFGDGGSGTIAYSVGCSVIGGCAEISHSYAGAGTFTVAASGTIGGNGVSASIQITVTGLASDAEVFVATGAHQGGSNGTVWRTDLEVHNPGTTVTNFAVVLLARDQDNSDAPRQTFTLNPGRSVRYADVLQSMFSFTGAGALWIIPLKGSLLVTSRTYNQLAQGSFGQFVPGITRANAIGYGQQARLIELSHDPTLTTGFRTNLGFVNESPAPIDVAADFYLATGVWLGSKEWTLPPYGFSQIDRAFEQVTGDPVADGYIVVQTTTVAARFVAYASVVDNITGDPIFVPAQIVH